MGVLPKHWGVPNVNYNVSKLCGSILCIIVAGLSGI